MTTRRRAIAIVIDEFGNELPSAFIGVGRIGRSEASVSRRILPTSWRIGNDRLMKSRFSTAAFARDADRRLRVFGGRIAVRRLILTLAACACLSGCSGWEAISNYDPVVEERITQLAYRTDEVAKRGDKGRLSLNDSRLFLEQSLATVKALITRELQTYRRTKEVERLECVQSRYEELLRRNQPIQSSSIRELHAVLFDMRYFQTRKHELQDWADSLAVDDTDATVDTPNSRDSSNNRSSSDHGSSSSHR